MDVMYRLPIRATPQLRYPGRLRGWAPSLALVAAVSLWWVMPPAAAETAQPGQPQGGPVRFASLKSDRVNLRSGPGVEYPTVWVYRRAGLPLEIIKDFEGWRQVRDADGATGWVVQHFLSGRRTALVMPWEVKPNMPAPQVELYGDDSENARVVAKIEAGVIANIATCDGKWCKITIDDYRGYMPQKRLWGVYAGETIK